MGGIGPSSSGLCLPRQEEGEGQMRKQHVNMNAERNQPDRGGNRKLALVGIIPNQILFSFSSDKDRGKRSDSLAKVE